MRATDIALPSNRKFGSFFSTIFGAAAGYFAFAQHSGLAVTFGILCFTTALTTIAKPSALLPFNRLWMRFGLLLASIIRPIVLGILFFGLITPVALFMRLAGRDELKLKPEKAASSWRARTPPGPASDSLKNQF